MAQPWPAEARQGFFATSRRRLFCLLLVVAPLAAKPGFDDAASLTALIRKRGLKAAIRPMADFEKQVAGLRTAVEREHKNHIRLSDKWWGWRRKYERDYHKRYKRPPVDYPVPQGLNRAFIDQEVLFGSARSRKLNLEVFQDSVVWYLKDQLEKQTDGDALAALGKGLRDKNIHQRVRCLRILRAAGEAARPYLERAAKSEKHPVLLGEILRAHGGVEFLTPFLNHAAWPVRSGAILGLSKNVPAGHEETGRLRDDLAWARGKPSAAGVEILGIRTSTLAILFCIDASSEQVWTQLKDHAKEAVAALPDAARFSIVLQGGETPTVFGKGSKSAALKWLDQHKVREGADLAGALNVALKLAGNGKGVAKFDTLFILQPWAPFRPQFGPYRQQYVRPREIVMEIAPLNDIRGLRIYGFGESGPSKSFYLESLAEPFLGRPRRK